MDAQGLTPLDRAFNSGHMALAEMMLRREKADQSEGLRHSTPLHRAAYLGLHEAVKSLLSYGTDPVVCDQQRETPLHKAARQGHLDVATTLAPLSDVNTASADGMTPLHWACVTGNAEMVNLLLQHGADPDLRNEALDGLTPLDLADSMGYQHLMKLLRREEVLV
jgi:cytohesin